MVPTYTAWYCTGVVLGCTATARYCKVAVQYYTASMPCFMVLKLD
jgi:hypothetical protein